MPGWMPSASNVRVGNELHRSQREAFLKVIAFGCKSCFVNCMTACRKISIEATGPCSRMAGDSRDIPRFTTGYLARIPVLYTDPKALGEAASARFAAFGKINDRALQRK